MKAAFTSFLASLVLTLPAAFSTAAQTTTPTPATNTFPSGTALLQGAQEAIRAAGTGRVSIRAPVTGPWVDLSIHEVDVSDRVKLAHVVDRQRLPGQKASQATRHEHIIVGKREAFRSTYGGWQCTVNQRVYPDDVSLLFLPATLTHIATVGEVQIGGAHAWHITARSIEKGMAGSAKTHLDLYLDTTTLLPLRQERSTTYDQPGRAPVHGRYRMTYSAFGATLHIVLPKQCGRI